MKGESMEETLASVVKKFRVKELGQIHGTWSGLAIIPEKDEFKTIKKGGIKS